MKIAVIIPTRGDRPQFLKQCHHLISKQTLKPHKVFVMDYKPESSQKDLTQRYKRGINKAVKAGCTVAVFWEDDDWYHPTYLEWLTNEWVKARRPQVFGVGETYYYHITAEARLRMVHQGRTSAFCTLVSLPYRGSWPADHYAFLDMHFHRQGLVKTVLFPKGQIKAIGIKHGIGMTGGGGHHPRFKWDMTGKEARQWFVSNMDEEISFYDKLKSSLPKQKAEKLSSRGRGSVTSPKNNVIKNGKNISRKKVIVSGASTQLRRRGHTIVKVRRK